MHVCYSSIKCKSNFIELFHKVIKSAPKAQTINLKVYKVSMYYNYRLLTDIEFPLLNDLYTILRGVFEPTEAE